MALGSSENRYLTRVGPVHSGYAVTGDPIQDAAAAVRSASLHPGKEGHTLDARMQRLQALMHTQMPDRFHAGTAVPQRPAINVPGAVITNPGAQGQAPGSLYKPAAPGGPMGPMGPGGPGGPVGPVGPMGPGRPVGSVGHATAVNTQQLAYPNNNLAPVDEYMPTPEPLAGDTVWQSLKDVGGRHTDSSNQFLENTLQNVHDDRTREMAFNLLDSTELEVVPGNDPRMLTIRNKTNPQKQVTLSEKQFLDSMKFFADPTAPALHTAKDPKIIQFFHVFNPDKEAATPFDGGPMAESSFHGFDPAMRIEEATKGMTPEQKKVYMNELGWQATLDKYRDKLEPIRTVDRSRTWMQAATSAMTLGIYGKPDPATSPVRVVQAMIGATSEQKAEAQMALEDMKTFRLLDWTEGGTILRPQQTPSEPTRAIEGSNIFNLVNNIFSPAKALNRMSFVSRFSPTGEQFFLESVVKAMSIRQKNAGANMSALGPMLNQATGRDQFMRKVEGTVWNVMQIARYFRPLGYFLGMTYPVWASALVFATDLTVSQFGRIMQYLSPLREKTQAEYVSGKVLETAGGVLDHLPQPMQNTINAVGLQYGSTISENAGRAIHRVVEQTASDSVNGAFSYATGMLGYAGAAVGSAAIGGATTVMQRIARRRTGQMELP